MYDVHLNNKPTHTWLSVNVAFVQNRERAYKIIITRAKTLETSVYNMRNNFSSPPPATLNLHLCEEWLRKTQTGGVGPRGPLTLGPRVHENMLHLLWTHVIRQGLMLPDSVWMEWRFSLSDFTADSQVLKPAGENQTGSASTLLDKKRNYLAARRLLLVTFAHCHWLFKTKRNHTFDRVRQVRIYNIVYIRI